MPQIINQTTGLQNLENKQKKLSAAKKSKKALILGFVVILALFVVIIFFWSGGSMPGGPIKQIISTGKSMVFKTPNQPVPPSLPFSHLTIPYLREKNYDSKIGELTEDYKGSNYTAYLTSYTSAGLKINALLTRPNGGMPPGGYPAIVFIHGYIPPAQYQTAGQAYSTYVDNLARNGFVVFKIDLRGHGSSEGEAGGGYFGADYVTDALSAISALHSSGFVNPKKIGMWGHSMAGNIIMRSFAVKPDIPAVVIWAGAVYSYTDQLKYGIQDQSYRPAPVISRQQNNRRSLFQKVGSPSASSLFWQKMAPTSFLKDLQGTIQIHHAIDDAVVNIGYSRDLVKLFKQNNVSYEYYEYPEGGHNISGASFTLAMNRTVEFFKKFLND